MNLKQFTNNEKQPKPTKLNERDLREFFNVQYAYMRSIQLAWDTARRTFGPAIDMPSEPIEKKQTSENTETNDVITQAEVDTAVSISAAPETQKVPEEVTAVLAASAVNAAEALNTTDYPDLEAIRAKVNNSFSAAPADTETKDRQSDYGLGA